MISLKNQIVLITGASSGIGNACARIFAGAGAKLILAARRLERLQQLADELNQDFGVETHLLQLDVRDRSHVESAITSLPPAWSAIDILINNAGLSRGLDKLYEGDFQDWEEMIDTNIKGLLYLTRYVVPGMVNRGRGHVINLGSIAGHQTYPGGNVYCGTKAAVKAISEGLKQDLLGTPVRVTSVDPGMVETEFSEVRFHGDTERAKKVYQGVNPLTPEDVADVIFFCATRSPHVNINEVILMPVDQASATLVNRKT
ncbi:Short-chain dehydrogenase/reductase SDR [Trichormus variabilis ATCC 29413]|uniref:Short-chain dehydrogenase/reductase SDR n=2 Tax=Anabaena variabilis TaxID=264691 RepID=Q3M937_TRIV2|nr:MULTISPECIES: SDR family oxidoreductase [Nostocaceae]ABA22499.1 Short-chain dehydrogenase/reductase SDR [Trichormus variabilis ATCC 29413]MBC1216566.1 SDR family oxidoreductase [Trichormus variabilis ARAD]MBC1257039.1 SDR family oxidoreductase [Trichormus variabilis V5]MBC1267544.1 SDR family oxidoreductase [Trichormus variabilis FSR]MBC1301016.1 SDR family oxidoreductase [Trichormus variabilis N2B]